MPHEFDTKLSAEEIAALERAMTSRAAAAPRSLADVPASFSSGVRCYVVYTNINCEERAAGGLRAAGFEVFLPTVTRMVKRGSRKKIKVERPLFSPICSCASISTAIPGVRSSGPTASRR
jgi:hypothetical protein